MARLAAELAPDSATTSPAARPPAAPSRLLVAVALLACLAGTVILLAGAWRIGISTDEPAHVIRYANLQEHGWYLLDDDFDGDEPGEWANDQYVYAPFFTQTMHGVNRALGLDEARALGTSIEAYAVRHLVVAACGLLGVAAVGAIGRRLLGSWSWGLVAAATLMAIPMWPGLSMFDIKDVPVATGYTLTTLGLVEILFAASRARPSWWRAMVPAALLAAGLVLAIGTRPGIWPGPAASVALAAGVVVLGAVRRGSSLWPLASMAAALVVAYGLLLLSYPAFFSRPADWIAASVLGSADYSGDEAAVAEGSWAYIPVNVVVTMPILLLAGGVAGCVMVVLRTPWRLTPRSSAGMLVGLQALTLPIVAMVHESLLYDELRQVLFACPAVALLLALGWQRMVLDAGLESRRAGGLLGLAWSLALLVPVAVQTQMFPYSYAYASPLSGSLAAHTEDDFWGTSYRELIPQIPRDEFVVCQPRLSERGITMRSVPGLGIPAADRSADCRTYPGSALAPFDLALGDPGAHTVEDSFLAVFTGGFTPGSNCRLLGTVERWRYVSRTVLSMVARCRLVLDAYPERGVDLSADRARTDYLLGGWTSHPARSGVQLREPFGSLGFELPEAWDGQAIRVDLAGAAAEVPAVTVNNRDVVVTPGGAGWSIDVEPSVVAAMGERRLVVTVARPAGPEPLRLTGVTVDVT